MKEKILILIMLIFNLFFFTLGNVNARDDKYKDMSVYDLDSMVRNKKAALLCAYNNNNKQGLKIYFVPADYHWVIFYTETNKKNGEWVNHSGEGAYKLYGEYSEIDNLKILHQNKIGQRWWKDNKYEYFKCTPYAHLDFNNDNEICIDDDQNCGGNTGTHWETPLKLNSLGLFSEIDNFSDSSVFSVITVDDILAKINETEIDQFNGEISDENFNSILDSIIREKTVQFVESKLDYKYMPQFLQNYLKKLDTYDSARFTTFKAQINTELRKLKEQGQLTEEQSENVQKVVVGLTTKRKQVIYGVEHEDKEPEKLDDFTTNCADFANGIQVGGFILLAVKIIIPLVIIIKSIFSIMSVVTNGKADEFNKIWKKVGLSLLGAFAIFFIPTIVNVMFGFVSRYNSNITEDSKICAACLFEPFNVSCTHYVNK